MLTVSASSKNKNILEWPAAQMTEPSKSGTLKSESILFCITKNFYCYFLKTERKSFFFIFVRPNLFSLQNYNLNRFA
jgi:hypothetical protein